MALKDVGLVPPPYMWLLAPVLGAGCVQGFRHFLNAGFSLVRLFGKRDRELFQGLPRETTAFV